MIKKFNFAGVSAAAIALSVLCPPPARAFNYTWSYTMFGGNLSGTLDGLSEGSNTPSGASPAYVTVTSGTGTYSPTGFSPEREIVGQTFVFRGASEINVASGVPINSGSSGVASFRFTGTTYTYDLNFLHSPSGFSSLSSTDGFFDMELKKVSLVDGSAQGQDSSTGAQSFTAAVPAPLPLLGLGAATAFSRKLKQRIALKRKQEEVGAAV